MSVKDNDLLVSSDWLAAHLDDDDVKVVDGSWYLPAEKREPRAEYLSAHIPGAVFFDIDSVSDTSNPLPHMFPEADKFSKEVGKLGISNSERVIAYDGGSMASAGRVWWMFRAFGHKSVSILNGGSGKWRAENRPLEADAPELVTSQYSARFNPGLVRSVDDVLSIIESGREQILDARSSGRFTATEPEPREGMRAGHMPGSFNLHYADLLAEDGTLRPTEELRACFATSGVDMGQPIVTSCGSGISATVLLLGLHLLGHTKNALYDGSWTEWGGRADTPIDT